jgi:hypothetical protein
MALELRGFLLRIRQARRRLPARLLHEIHPQAI